MGASRFVHLAIAVVYPRLKGSRRGHVFWNGITEFSSPSEYVESVTRLTEANILEEVVRHGYELANVCKAKWRVLNWALVVGTLGGVATIILVLFKEVAAG